MPNAVNGTQRHPDPRRPRHADGRADAPVLDAGVPVDGARRPTARRCACMLLGEKLIAFRDTTGASASWTTAARTAAPRCSSAATRKTACAASITAGSSTPTATAWTCRTCRRLAVPDKVKAEGLPDDRAGRPDLDLYGQARDRAAAAGARGLQPPGGSAQRFRCTSANATGCSALEGDIDTSHFGFLHAGSVKADDVDPATSTSTRSSIVRRATMSRRRTGARCTRPIGRPRPASSITASPTSCSRASR